MQTDRHAKLLIHYLKKTHNAQGNTTFTTHKISPLLKLIEKRYQVQPSDKELHTEHIPLTYSMVQSPSWEANWFAASQEIPRILWNPKVLYRTHKRQPSVSILGQPNPGHISTSHLLNIHPNIIHPFTPKSPQWSLYLRFPTKTVYTPYPHPYAPHAQPISLFSILTPAEHIPLTYLLTYLLHGAESFLRS